MVELTKKTDTMSKVMRRQKKTGMGFLNVLVKS